MDTNVSRRDLLRWAAALAPASRLLAWQDDPKFSTGINVVNVLATVRDKQGKIAKDLVQDDFSIEEDGRPQTIRYFARQTDLPLTLGLLVDTSGSERREIPAERRASYTFFEQVLREDKDKAFVLHFDREVELLQDVTSSRRDLEDALHDLDSGQPQLNRRGGQQQPPYGGGGQGGGQQGRAAGGTALYDAVMLASTELMRKQQGRKAAILLSDGEDNGSKVSLTSAIEAAQREDTLVYSIRFHDDSVNNGFGPALGGGRGRRGGLGVPFPGGGGTQRPGGSRVDGKKILQQISSETGGSYFEVTSKETLDKIYSQIEEELRNQYSLGYTSDQTGGGYRKIHVAVKPKNLIVQTREGYYATRSSDVK